MSGLRSQTPAAIMAGLGLCLTGTLVGRPAMGAVLYEPILEWNGPVYRVIHATTTEQLVDDPTHDIAFAQPTAVAAREHGTHQRDVVYVVDSGHSRIQGFEVNATYNRAVHPSSVTPFTWKSGGVSGASQWDATHINLPEWGAPATCYVVPFSESITIDGNAWARVADLTGFTADRHVYAMTYGATTDAPSILFPDGSLTIGSTFSIQYLVSAPHTGGSPEFGIGDVDYALGRALTGPQFLFIDGTSGGPSSWQLVRSIALSASDRDSTSDDIFLVDAADPTEKLFYYTVTSDGEVSFRETYTDHLSTPWSLSVAHSGASQTAVVSVSNDLGPFDQMSASVVDASQVTGHVYTVAVVGSNVTIVDGTTGRVIAASCDFSRLANPFGGIPGVSLPKNPAVGVTTSILTSRPIPGRFLFVADTTANQVKVISAADGTAWPGDWLPGDPHLGAPQPAGADSVGLIPDRDYFYTTPHSVPEDYAIYTNTFPIQYASLDTIRFDPTGARIAWTRSDNLSTAGPTDKMFELDWNTGRITFGDGTHGAIPPGDTPFTFNYTTTPDVLRYGTYGRGSGQFSRPHGVAARWNPSLGVYDVYVADTGNHRLQKFAFSPPVPALNLPARMEFICAWNRLSAAADSLLRPVDVTVAVDQPSDVANQSCFIAVADEGRHQVVLFKDTAATSGGSAAPTYETTLGQSGSVLGRYGKISSVTFLRNRDDLDIYTTDVTRGVVTKYEEIPGPMITLSYAGVSSLPRTLPPSSSYPFRFSTTDAPSGGFIDFYYDTASAYNSGTSKLCFTSRSIAATAGSATWVFAGTPGGTPASHAYYLYARMKDADGNVVASDQTSSDRLLTLDATVMPTLKGADAIDGDRTLYLQNGLSRVIKLQVAYPESVSAVGFDGTFDPTLLAITGIGPADGWDGTGATNILFTQSYNNTTGVFHVNTSATGTPFGLVDAGPFTLAMIQVRAKSGALTPTVRFKNGVLTLVKSGSGISNIHGVTPSSWRTQTMNLRLGYLGDLATDGSGADSVVPHLAPKPDGKINFADQMVFTAGWNGANHVQDRIADLGPALGQPPNLQSNPDGLWDLEDILAFTAMYSWAAAGGYEKDAPASPVSPSEWATDEPVLGREEVYTVSHVHALSSEGGVVLDLRIDQARDLTGVLLRLLYDPAQLEFISAQDGGFLRGADGALFFSRTGPGWVEVTSSRLDRGNPGVSGSGTVASLAFRILQVDPSPLQLQFDLRGSNGGVLSRGVRICEAFAGDPLPFALLPATPNPARGSAQILFSLEAPSSMRLDVFDAMGRRVRQLLHGTLGPGYHVACFDGRDGEGRSLPSGVYFTRLESAGRQATRRLVLTR